MTKDDSIIKFINNRPDALAVYGYGSGVFKQSSYSDIDKPQIDLIFIVNDVNDWYLDNVKNNSNDYSLIGKAYFNIKAIKGLKGKNNISYVSNIKYKDYMFKYGVISIDDFVTSLNNWSIFFVAGRFQKPTKEYFSNNTIKSAISNNIKCALMVGCLLCEKETDFINLYEVICGLSYIGDIRMKIAENPNKIQNIIKGSMSEFVKMYLINNTYITFLYNGKIIINHDLLLNNIDELPSDLLYYLECNYCDFQNIISVRKNIYKYFKEKNRKESINQIKEGILTNGIVRSVPYVLSKIKKKFKK